MSALYLGLASAYTLAAILLLALDPVFRLANPWAVSFSLSTVVVPTLVACAVAEAMALFRGKFRWCSTSQSPTRRFVRGTITGALGVILMIVVVGVTESIEIHWPDSVSAAIAAAVSTAASCLFSRRIGIGTCSTCGYDLRGLTPAHATRCPECGTVALLTR